MERLPQDIIAETGSAFPRRHLFSTPTMRLRSLLTVLLLGGVLLGLLRWPGLPGPAGGQGGAPALAAVGRPQAQDETLRVLDNRGFTVGYAPARRSAAWVSYAAREIERRRYLDRPEFRPDERVAAPVTGRAYAGSGFDRGHLAPNYLIANLYGKVAQRDSFLLSNVVPQRPRLNQLLWQRLEELEADELAPRWGGLRVTVGPVFGSQPRRLRDGPAVAEAFYRIWLDRTAEGELRALALLVPQSVRGDEPLDRFVVSVDRVEAATGLDFHPDLAPAAEAALEAEPAHAADWGLAALACQPARYADDWRGRDGITLDFDRCD